MKENDGISNEIEKYMDNTLKLRPRASIRGEKFFQQDMIDTEVFSRNLDKLIGNEDNFALVASSYGKNAADDLKALNDLANGLKTSIKELRTRESELADGALAYIKDKGIIPGTLKLVHDYTTHILKYKGREPYRKTAEMDRAMKVLKRLTGETSEPLIQKFRGLSGFLGTLSKEDANDSDE